MRVDARLNGEVMASLMCTLAMCAYSRQEEGKSAPKAVAQARNRDELSSFNTHSFFNPDSPVGSVFSVISKLLVIGWLVTVSLWFRPCVGNI